MTTAMAPPSAPARVLVVEDAPELVQLLCGVLERSGYETDVARTGDDAVAVAREFQPDVVLLDLGLPGLDGMEVCRRIRSFSDAYVVMLTARTDELDRVSGLEVGADDYVTKPFSPRELMARIRAMLRRPRGQGPGGGAARTVGDLTVDPLGRTVHRDGEELQLTRIEFDLLDALTSQPSLVFTRVMLRDRVWGPDWYGDDHVVDVHMANLRKKIDRRGEPSRVRTVRGVGYRMEAPT
jgi:DNA-binding response OmpR family regulator